MLFNELCALEDQLHQKEEKSSNLFAQFHY